MDREYEEMLRDELSRDGGLSPELEKWFAAPGDTDDFIYYDDWDRGVSEK